jgi:hypothetical protein
MVIGDIIGFMVGFGRLFLIEGIGLIQPLLSTAQTMLDGIRTTTTILMATVTAISTALMMAIGWDTMPGATTHKIDTTQVSSLSQVETFFIETLSLFE